MTEVWTLDNPAFVSFVFYAAVLALKMVIMAPLTGHYRLINKAFVNAEDANMFGAKETKINPDVERVRRAHQNDIENIPVFFALAPLFLFTDPSPFLAKMLFRLFAGSRILHTFFYLRGSQLRPIFFIIPMVISIFMAVRTICFFW